MLTAPRGLLAQYEVDEVLRWVLQLRAPELGLVVQSRRLLVRDQADVDADLGVICMLEEPLCPVAHEPEDDPVLIELLGACSQ